MLSFKQGSIKYHFLSLWYDSTCDRTLVSRAIGKHCNHYAMSCKNSYLTQDKEDVSFFTILIAYFFLFLIEELYYELNNRD